MFSIQNVLRRARTLNPAVALPIACLLAVGHARADDDAAAKAFMENFRKGVIEAPLDRFVSLPGIWQMTPDALDAAFALPKGVNVRRNPHFNWMSEKRERAVFMPQPYSNLRLNMTIFDGDLPLEEVTVDFIGEKMNGIRMSLFNRGDSEDIGADEFDRRFRITGQKMNEIMGVRPTMRRANYNQGLVTEGWIWISPQGMALLDYNPEAMDGGDREFLRLWLAPRDAQGLMAAAFQNRPPSSARMRGLADNVSREESGDVLIRNIPMVDQGPKGYCVVASVQRLFEYYSIPADQHQLAQIAGSDAARGTSLLAIAEALGKIDFRFKTRFRIHAMAHNGSLVTVNQRQMTVDKPFSEADFLRMIRRSVDSGIPVLWSLILGQFPEIPPISPQTSGGHMRMIIGYNEEKNQIIFSDSWGAGHEIKRMNLRHAYRASTALFTISPTVM